MKDNGAFREDAATGSANCALIGHLMHGLAHPLAERDEPIKISQGVEMGRSSVLYGENADQGRVKIGGCCVSVMEGFLTLH